MYITEQRGDPSYLNCDFGDLLVAGFPYGGHLRNTSRSILGSFVCTDEPKFVRVSAWLFSPLGTCLIFVSSHFETKSLDIFK